MTNYLTTDLDRAFDHLFRRTIGYDYLPDFMENWGTKVPAMGNFPPYDIQKVGENQYTLTLALAGYSANDVEIMVEDERLFVKTREPSKTLTDAGAKPEHMVDQFLYKGIAKRSFNLSYALGEHMEVRSADFENGLLTISLERVIPEEKKPRVIPITGHTSPALEDASKKAA